MPHYPRLDASHTLHPVRVRGLERRGLFNADTVRDNVVACLAVLPVARRGAATAARWCRLLREP